MQKEEKRCGNSVWRKNTTLCHSFTAQVTTERPTVMIGPCGLFCLAAHSSEVMIAFWGRGSKVMWHSINKTVQKTQTES